MPKDYKAFDKTSRSMAKYLDERREQARKARQRNAQKYRDRSSLSRGGFR